MKIDILFVHFALVAAVVVPYLIFILAAVREQKELRRKFNEEASRFRMSFDQVDKWNWNIIGLDKGQQKVLFFQQRGESFISQLINLKTIRSSSLLHQVRRMKINDKNEDILQRIDLEITFHNGEKQLISLYDSNVTYTQDYEMKNAERWNRILNDAVHFRPLIHSAA